MLPKDQYLYLQQCKNGNDSVPDETNAHNHAMFS
jgi:hypothetical protein